MKRLYTVITVLAAVLTAAVSCDIATFSGEYVNTPGEADVEGCYGVFFPTQDLSAYKQLDPSEPTTFTIVAKRENSKGDITVPVEIQDDQKVFQLGSLQFADGQEESELVVDFPSAREGVEYSATIQISDPLYASRYSKNPASITFSVNRVKWDYIGEGDWTDDFFSYFFGVPAGTKWKVNVYENGNVKGLYRIEDPYTENCPWNEPGDWDTSKHSTFEMHAEDPKNVYFTLLQSACDWGYGNFLIISMGGYYIRNGLTVDEAKAQGAEFGTCVNGVIKFPKNSVLIGMSDYNGGGLYKTNGSAGFKLVLPGGIDVDYSLEAKAGETVDGVTPVEFKTGADVAKIRYAVFEGVLSGTAIKKQGTEIAAGSVEGAKEVKVENGAATVGITLEKTGIYTIVAVAFDGKGAAQNTASATVHYVAKGDEALKAVKLHLGIGSAEKFPGANTDNSVEVWAFADSSDLLSVKIAAFSYMDLKSDMNGCKAKLAGSAALDDSIVELINTDGFIGKISGLLPGTEYYLMAWASNGYESDFFLSSASQFTTGEPLDIYKSFTYDSYNEEFYPEDESAFVGKTFNLYAVDFYGTTGMREYVGKVEITDSEYEDEGPDDYGLMDEYVTVKGLAGPVTQENGFDDALTFDCYGGELYLAAADDPIFFFALGTGQMFSGSYLASFIPVLDGYYAYVSNPNYYIPYNFAGLAFMNGNSPYAIYYDYLLVDPAKDDNGLAPAAKASVPANVSFAVEDAKLEAFKKRPMERKTSGSSVIIYNNVKPADDAEVVAVRPVATVSLKKESSSTREIVRSSAEPFAR